MSGCAPHVRQNPHSIQQLFPIPATSLSALNLSGLSTNSEVNRGMKNERIRVWGKPSYGEVSGPRTITMLKCCLNRQGLFVTFFLAFFCVAIAAQEERGIRHEDGSLLRAHTSRTVETLGPPTLSAASDQLLSRFLIAEQRVREALNSHTFKRDVLLQTIGPNGEVTGEYVRNSVFIFDDRGNRIERVLFHPRSTLRGMKITKEDIQDLAGAQLLGVDINEVNKYLLDFIGEEALGGREAYIINVRPRQMTDPHRMNNRAFV